MAEQYLSTDSAMALRTLSSERFLPFTMKWRWIRVKTLGGSVARSAESSTMTSSMAWRPFRRISTTSQAEQASGAHQHQLHRGGAGLGAVALGGSDDDGMPRLGLACEGLVGDPGDA